MKKIIPIIGVTIIAGITFTSFVNMTSNKNSPSNVLDGKYTLHLIVMPDGETNVFSHGGAGELTVKDLKTTFTTPTQAINGEIEKSTYEVKPWGFVETDSTTNQKYHWLKINN